MKKALLSLLLCFALFGVARADVVEIGDGGTANNSYLPGYNYYNYSLTQQIYTAEEIGMAGTINSIAFKNTGAEKTRTYNVYMLLTDKETFSANDDWVAMSDNDLVFAGSLTFAVGEWTTITLDTPFAYNGSSNLLVGVADVTGDYSSAPHMACLVFDATSQAIRAYRDASAYDITNPGVNGSVLNVKNQIQLDITPSGTAVCYKPTLAVSGITHNTATLTVDGGSGTYNVQYKAASATVWTDVATNSTNSTFTISGLTPLTAYDVQAQSVCDGGATSEWRTASFSTTAVAVAVGDAWSDDFEGTSCAWELVNGEIDNAWAWGSAATNGGSHALYISNDGGTTNAYTVNSDAMVYATKLLNFTEGKFEFSFDWMANGESTYDYLRVALVPSSVTLTAGTTLPSGLTTTAVPTGWIAVDGGSKLNLVTEWQNKAVAVNVPAGNYYLVLAWRNDHSAGNQPPAAVDNVSITKLACAYDVTGLAVNNITANSATLVWNNSEVGQWQVAYADNASFDHATEVIVSDSTYTMSNLQPATTYYAKVRAFCGGEDFGGWSSEINFLTECVAITEYPYTENFDSYTAASGFLPLCWDRINTGTSYDTYPYVTSSNSHSTSNCLYFYIYGSTSSTNISDQYAILPQMENLAGKQITLFAKAYNNQSTFKIGTMTDPADVTTFTEIATQELTTSYQEFVYDVPATATGNYIAIMMERPDASGSVSRGVYIDDITINFPPACFKPTGLVASDPTAHGATLNWNLTDETQTVWDVQVSDTSDFSRIVVFEENVNSHVNYMLTGLNPETQYYVRVRGNCGAEDGVSEWSSPANFTTTIACPAPTGFAVADLSGYTATLNWTGTSESYTVSYRTAAYTDGLEEGFGTSLPTGWENKIGLLAYVMNDSIELSSGSQWFFGNSNGVFDQHARINIYSSTSGTNRYGWLISPAFTVLENASLTFDLALTAYSGTLTAPATDGTDDKFVVLITTDNEATWTILRQWDNEEGSTYVYNNINSTAEGEQVSIDLSSYAGQSVRIAFYGESTVSNADNHLHIDNVHCGIDHEAGQWETVTVDEAPAILTDLIPETAYEAKLQGNCGDDGLSLETNIISFTTLNTCPVPTNLTVVDSLLTATTAGLSWHGSIDVDSYTVRYRVVEHIEGGINETFDATSLPSGWKNRSGLLSDVMEGTALTNTTQWYFGASNGVFDSHARINIYGNGSSERHGWLITPTFTLASSTFTFDLALTAYSGILGAPETTGDDDKFVVLISTDNMETWTILRQWDNEEGSTYVYNDIANTAEGEQVSIDLSAYVGQNVCIAFYGESTVANADNNLHIDNVLIGTPTTIPTGEWQTAGATTTNVTLTGLAPMTPYEAQVKSDCSDPEEWSNTVTFTTPEQTTLTQTVALAEGVNWFSTYLEITLEDLEAALEAAGSGIGTTIKGKTQSVSLKNNGWKGTLKSLD
ncbi:MAG: fibronectin type III domain-containing protein, partial [Bacteroidales bacterium]|nr:fibronectin type III domain-containing protein [Bacteroidales bacterium]